LRPCILPLVCTLGTSLSAELYSKVCAPPYKPFWLYSSAFELPNYCALSTRYGLIYELFFPSNTMYLTSLCPLPLLCPRFHKQNKLRPCLTMEIHRKRLSLSQKRVLPLLFNGYTFRNVFSFSKRVLPLLLMAVPSETFSLSQKRVLPLLFNGCTFRNVFSLSK